MNHHQPRWIQSTRIAVGVVATTIALRLSAAEPAGTTTFEPPVEITPAGTNQDFGQHAVTRLADWDADGDLDLLIGGGNGRVWRASNDGQGRFQRPEPIQVQGKPLRFGKQLTTACLVDLDGDKLPDLIVAHGEQVSVLKNRGTANHPEFAVPEVLTGVDNKPLDLLQDCGGRIDVGDWDGDGDADLAAGNFSGPITLFENAGNARIPKFATGVPLQVNQQDQSYSYNVHPTMIDLNRDGVTDVAYGMNWGTFGFLMATRRSAQQTPELSTEVTPVLSTGRPIDLRSIAGDDATPTFGDLDGDGTLDMVSGGRQGKLFLLRGVPVTQQLDRLSEIMREHAADLGPALKADEALRTEVLGIHHGIYRLCQGFLATPSARRPIRDWYHRHITDNARWLKHGTHGADAPHIASLSYQTWAVLMLLHEGDPDAPAHRQFVADTIGFQGRLRDILLEFGTLIIENGKATSNQLETLHSYLSQIPAELLGDRSIERVTEVITIGEYLGERLEVLNAGGVNIFASESGKPGSSENPFPKDFRPRENDYFGVVLAHELNHRVDATRFVSRPEYDEQYWRHMRKISGSDVKFQQPAGIGVDWEATQEHFQEQKLWDGKEKNWNTAWADYWLTGPGQDRTLNVCRNETTYQPPRFGIPFFLETRQESIASLANQYFTDSEVMLEFAMDRYRRGAPGCLDEWLLMADVYSLGTLQTFLYRHENGTVRLARSTAQLKRDSRGRITAVITDQRTYAFELDPDGLVEKASVR